MANSREKGFGSEENHWIDSQGAVTARLERDDDRNTSVAIGTNFRF